MCTNPETITASPTIASLDWVTYSAPTLSLLPADDTHVSVAPVTITLTSTVTNSDGTKVVKSGYTVTVSLIRNDCTNANTIGDITELPQSPASEYEFTLAKESYKELEFTMPVISGGLCGDVYFDESDSKFEIIAPTA